MDINENQKSVSKRLRNTLNIDMLWKSPNCNNRKMALFLHIAEKLGEDNHSPLYKRIITGENTKTIDCCITTENIRLALNKTQFLHTYAKNNAIISYGIFDKQDNDKTMEVLYPFLRRSLEYIYEICTKPWEAGSNGYITINNTIYALIRVIDDCAQIIYNKDKSADADKIYQEMENGFLFYVAEVLLELSDENKQKIRQAKGAGGPVEAYRIIQVALNQKCPEYINEDLAKYIEENCQNNNPAAGDLLTRLEARLRELIKNEYKSKEDEWMREYVPSKLSEQWVSYMAIAKHRGESVNVWDLITFDAIKELAKHKSNWSTFYRSFLEIDGKSKIDTLNWLEAMSQYKKSVENNRQIPTSQYKEIEEIANKFGILVE
jgi:DNA sulfur modification protein DndB